nr:antitermination protein [uncultured Enterobacter sp.]
MKLETALRQFSPQGVQLSDDVKSTSPDKITQSDVMYAIGATGRRAGFGLTAFLGKAGVSDKDKRQAEQALARFALETVPKNVRKAAGDNVGHCVLLLAQFAFAEYARSAATSATCQCCQGKGLIERRDCVTKYAGLYSEDGEERVAPIVEYQNVRVLCKTCQGKGRVTARCRCKGTGKVLDRAATKALGAPVSKECERCSGKGFITTPSTHVYKAIVKIVPDLHVRTWTRNWKPFFDALVAKCDIEEGVAETEFQRLMRNPSENNNI